MTDVLGGVRSLSTFDPDLKNRVNWARGKRVAGGSQFDVARNPVYFHILE